MTDLSKLIQEPAWFAHHVDFAGRTVDFVLLARGAHQAATFLSDDSFEGTTPRCRVALGDVMAAAAELPQRTSHFIFHSAFCGSTLLTRLLDIPGVAMGLKEPAGLNDAAHLLRNSGRRVDIKPALKMLLALYGRPFAAGETVVVKPSNVANSTIDDLMMVSPSSHSLLLYSPLPAFLRSVAAKGLFTRIWMRRLGALLALLPEFDSGFSNAERWEHTDLQVAAMAWLQQQAQFARLARVLGRDRVATLDSATMFADVSAVLSQVGTLFGLADQDALTAAATSPARFQDSKRHDRQFDAAMREKEHAAAERAYGDEIAKVVEWTKAVARHCDVPMTLDLPLVDYKQVEPDHD